MLADAAHCAGITEQADYAAFQNAGYMGLYGGLRVSDIHARKKLRVCKVRWSGTTPQ